MAIGCEFVGNRATGYGGAAYRLSAATNCLFAYNQSTNQGGACQRCYGISACTATGNGSLAQRGGAFSESDVYGSTISNNYAYITRGGAGTKSQFTGCTFAGKGGLSGCGARDCVFTGVEPSSTSDYLFDCLHNSGGPMGVTNCLITGCSGFTYLFNVEGTTGAVVNCTVAGNAVTSAGRLMRVSSGAHYEKVDGKTTEVYSVPGEAAFVNCLFAGNVLADGKAADLSLSLFDAANSTGTSKCAMSNCLYTATDPSLTDANADMSGVFQGKPHFTAGDTRFPDAPYYSLRYSSAARGRGQNMGWMSDATDMAGNARIFDGTVDIGCYECILPNDGTIMIVR